MSIKAKLLVLALSISLVPISIITVVYYVNTRSTLTKHAINEMTAIAESKRLHIISFLTSKKGRTIDFSSDGFIRDSLEIISGGGEQGHAVSKLNRHLLTNKKSLDPFILDIDVIDLNGIIVSSTMKEMIGHKVSDYKGLKQLLDKKLSNSYFKEPHYSKTLNRLNMDFAAPVFPKIGGDPIGFILLHYDSSALNSITSERTGMGDTGEVYIVNKEKKMLTESRFIKDAVLNQFVDTEPVRKIIDHGYGNMTGVYNDYRGIPIVGASIAIPEYSWILLAEVDKAEALGFIRKLKIFTISMGGLSAVVVILLVIILSRRITNPIQKLVDGTKKIAEGDLGFKIKTESRDEIGYLANSFNEMTTQLEESRKQIDDYAFNLEKKVEVKTDEIRLMLDELKYKNYEMEELIYVTSHDLRSPLVNIQGFSKELRKDIDKIVQNLNQCGTLLELKEKLSSILEKDIAESLRFISSSSSKMDTLLSGLLRLSRMGRVVLDIKQLDMNKLINEVIVLHEYKIKEVDVTCTVEELPPCSGDEAQVNQIFSNLLDNALKYLDNDRKGIIKISGREENGYVTYCMEDNGIGIEERHQEKVFEIFYRLNLDDSTIGEGLGLSIVRRILSRIGGKIWLESEYGKGSKFFVSLPV